MEITQMSHNCQVHMYLHMTYLWEVINQKVKRKKNWVENLINIISKIAEACYFLIYFMHQREDLDNVWLPEYILQFCV